MPRENVDTIIVGGGVAGLSTAWHLSRDPSAGRVLLLEREALCGSCSSAQNAAILRSFGLDPVTAAMARASARFLANPPAGFAPHPLLEPVGLILGASGSAASAMLAALDDYGPAAGARQLGRGELGRLAPHVEDSRELYLHFQDEGQLDVAAEVEGFLRGAREQGVEVRTGCAVTRLLSDERGVHGVLLADGSELRAKTTLIAAGGWAAGLGQAAGSRVSMQATRRHLMVSAPDSQIDPRWPIVWLDDAGFYCRPESGGMLLSACDLTQVDPDHCQRDPAVLELFARKASEHLPRFPDLGAAHYWCGMRTLTEDQRFLIGPDPEIQGLFWVAALGGHGMSCAPEVGRLASSLLLGLSHLEDRALVRALDPGRTIRTHADTPK